MENHIDRRNMPKSLSPRKEFSFRLRNGTTIDEVISVFSRYFDKENRLPGLRRITVRTYVSGSVKMLLAETAWGFKYVASVLLFYAGSDRTWRVQIQGFARGRRLGALDKNLVGQIMNFFETQGSNLLQICREGTSPAGEGTVSRQLAQAELDEAITCSECSAVQFVADPLYCCNCGKELATIKAGGSSKRPEKRTTTSTTPTMAVPPGICSVCRIALRSGELLAWCPNCGATAHRRHLLEWINGKGGCPSCGRHLTVSELAQQLHEAHLQETTEQVSKAS